MGWRLRVVGGETCEIVRIGTERTEAGGCTTTDDAVAPCWVEGAARFFAAVLVGPGVDGPPAALFERTKFAWNGWADG